MNTRQIADRLVALCRQGQFEQAQRELYAQDAISREMPGMDGGPTGNVDGLAAILKKGEDWMANVAEMHSASVGDPVVAGNWFALTMGIDATFKDRGRMAMEEVCVYRVRDGKIASEQFFYDTE